MRIAFAALVLLGSAALAAQPPKEPPKVPGKEPPKEQPKEPPPKDDEFVPTPKEAQPRYGVKPRVKQYPQDTPKTALKSAYAAIEAPAFPDESSMIRGTPQAFSCVSITELPRSL